MPLSKLLNPVHKPSVEKRYFSEYRQNIHIFDECLDFIRWRFINMKNNIWRTRPGD